MAKYNKFTTESEVSLSLISDTEYKVTAWLNGGSYIEVGTVEKAEVQKLGTKETCLIEFVAQYTKHLTVMEASEKFEMMWYNFSDSEKADSMLRNAERQYKRSIEWNIDKRVQTMLSDIL